MIGHGVIGRGWRLLERWLGWVIVLLLRAYRAVVSPLYGPTCRFYPSCSEYALVAVHRHGPFRGGWLALRRLSRCHPWNPGGIDDVPAAKGSSESDGAAGITHAPSLRRAA